MNHGKHMLICVAIAVVGAIALAAAGLNIAYGVLFVIPCMLMMAAMIWMMMGGDKGRGGSA